MVSSAAERRAAKRKSTNQKSTPNKLPKIHPKTEAQGAYMRAIETKSVVFGLGPAGTGKTFVAVSLACEMLLDNEIDRILITRPVVSAGEEIGFLPGNISEKFSPYFAPVEHILRQRLGNDQLVKLIKSQKIVAMPMAFMRGWTFENCFVLLDEAQNASKAQLKLLLTRLGEPVKCVIDGDPTQIDIDEPSGLLDALRRLEPLDEVAVVRFTEHDIVRSDLCTKICVAYGAR